MLLLMSGKPIGIHSNSYGMAPSTGEYRYDGELYHAAKLYHCREQTSNVLEEIGARAESEYNHILGIAEYGSFGHQKFISERVEEVNAVIQQLMYTVAWALENQLDEDASRDQHLANSDRLTNMANTLVYYNRGRRISINDYGPHLTWKPGELERESGGFRAPNTIYGNLMNIPLWCFKHVPIMSFLMHIPRLAHTLMAKPHINLTKHRWKYRAGKSVGIIRNDWCQVFQYMYLLLGYGFSIYRNDGSFWTTYANLLYGTVNRNHLSNLLAIHTGCNGYNTFFKDARVKSALPTILQRLQRHLTNSGCSAFIRPN